mgnify:CR=1 FL=1
MRKSTHAWYKMARAEHSYALAMDFVGGVKDDRRAIVAERYGERFSWLSWANLVLRGD